MLVFVRSYGVDQSTQIINHQIYDVLTRLRQKGVILWDSVFVKPEVFSDFQLIDSILTQTEEPAFFLFIGHGDENLYMKNGLNAHLKLPNLRSRTFALTIMCYSGFPKRLKNFASKVAGFTDSFNLVRSKRGVKFFEDSLFELCYKASKSINSQNFNEMLGQFRYSMQKGFQNAQTDIEKLDIENLAHNANVFNIFK